MLCILAKYFQHKNNQIIFIIQINPVFAVDLSSSICLDKFKPWIDL